jgi:hypothetical protein
MQEKDKHAATVQQVRKRLFELIGEYDYKGQLVASKPGRIQQLKDQIEAAKAGKSGPNVTPDEDVLPVSDSTMDRFHVRKDPTLLFGGIKSPWQDYMAKLPVRLNTQLVTSSTADAEWDNSFNDAFVKKLCDGLDLGSDQQNGFDMKGPLGKLLIEFKHLRPGVYASATDLPAGTVMPYYRDDASPTVNESSGRDRWQDRQPWFPLFIEWEALHSHVPFDKWAFRDNQPRRYDGIEQTRYTIDGDLRQNVLPQKDQRLVSGRVLILPQPSFSLVANIKQILDTTGPETLADAGIDAEQQKLLAEKIQNLEFLSAPISA